MKSLFLLLSVVKACEEQDDDNDKAHCALVASVEEIACHICALLSKPLLYIICKCLKLVNLLYCLKYPVTVNHKI